MEYSHVADKILRTIQFAPEGKIVLGLKRHGKVLDFCLDGDCHLISGLGMSGGWRMSDTEVKEKHTHVQFEGACGGNKPIFLAYVDPRRFGRMMYLDGDGFARYAAERGMDVTSEDFRPEYIYSVFKRYPLRKLKEVLLEQQYFAGIGNYLASEVCAHARLRPTRRVGALSRKDCKRIWEAVGMVIGGQIEHKGLTFQGGLYGCVWGQGGGVEPFGGVSPEYLRFVWQNSCQKNCHGPAWDVLLPILSALKRCSCQWMRVWPCSEGSAEILKVR